MTEFTCLYLYEYLYVPILPTSFTIPSPCLQAFTQLYYLAVKLCVEAACYCHRPNPPPLTYLRITKIHAFFHLRSWLFRDFRGFCEILLSFWLLAISAIARKDVQVPTSGFQVLKTGDSLCYTKFAFVVPCRNKTCKNSGLAIRLREIMRKFMLTGKSSVCPLCTAKQVSGR